MSSLDATPTPPATKSMDEIVALCRRRGFIFQSSEIYGGINGFWDYGPLGTELKRNLRNAWWTDLVHRDLVGPFGESVDIVGVDCTIIMNPRVWEASGHVGGFADLMSTCRRCKKLVRSDHVWNMVEESEWYRSLAEMYSRGDVTGLALKRWGETKGRKLAPNMAIVREPSITISWLAERMQAATEPQAISMRELIQYLATEQLARDGFQTPCPYCGGELTEPKPFNLMFKTLVGAVEDPANIAYLRPETAQGIFVNFENVVNSTRVRVPFGIAQVGKSFRNEVTPRNFTFRSREFEQMEMEFFIHPSQAVEWYRFWRTERFRWWQSIGLAGDNLQLRDHDKEELAHYAKEGAGVCDVEYRFPFTAPGFGELEGVAHRADFDLRQHAEHSGRRDKMKYFDQERNERYFPHVIEPAAGADRGTLALICEAFTVDPSRPSGVYMRFHPRMAPVKAGIFPLVNKDGLPEIGERLYRQLRRKFVVEYDAKQSIGKRYARMDEAGTPFCIAIDGQSRDDQSVTVRHRDTQQQERIGLDAAERYLSDRIGEA
ncbi:MAG: glycine--tRNA ligase [Phycisphaerales bacterium]